MLISGGHPSICYCRAGYATFSCALHKPGGVIYPDNKHNGTPWSLCCGGLAACWFPPVAHDPSSKETILSCFFIFLSSGFGYLLLCFCSLLLFPPNCHLFLDVQSIALKILLWGGEGVTGTGCLWKTGRSSSGLSFSPATTDRWPQNVPAMGVNGSGSP